jgi:hypothetical protein
MDEPIKKRQHGSAPSERRGGRVKGSVNRRTAEIRDLSERLGVDPCGYLLAIVACPGYLQVPVFDAATGKPLKGEDGQPVLQYVAVSLRQKLDACRDLMPYIAPRLQSVALSGKDGGPVEIAALDMTALLANPELARQAQRLALQIADQRDPNANNAPQVRPYDHYDPK